MNGETMEITREVVLVKAEESDQCTVTLSIGTTEFDLAPEEAIHAGFELIQLGMDAADHEREEQALELDRAVSSPTPWFDVDTAWWCGKPDCHQVFASKAEADSHEREGHAA